MCGCTAGLAVGDTNDPHIYLHRFPILSDRKGWGREFDSKGIRRCECHRAEHPSTTRAAQEWGTRHEPGRTGSTSCNSAGRADGE